MQPLSAPLPPPSPALTQGLDYHNSAFFYKRDYYFLVEEVVGQSTDYKQPEFFSTSVTNLSSY